MLGGETVQSIMANHGFDLGDFAPYPPVPEKELIASNVQVHYLGYTSQMWIRRNATIMLLRSTGFKANTNARRKLFQIQQHRR